MKWILVLQFYYDYLSQLSSTTNRWFQFYTYYILIFIWNYDNINYMSKLFFMNEWLFLCILILKFTFKVKFKENMKYK
jgi:hypothetical protein